MQTSKVKVKERKGAQKKRWSGEDHREWKEAKCEQKWNESVKQGWTFKVKIQVKYQSERWKWTKEKMHKRKGELEKIIESEEITSMNKNRLQLKVKEQKEKKEKWKLSAKKKRWTGEDHRERGDAKCIHPNFQLN